MYTSMPTSVGETTDIISTLSSNLFSTVITVLTIIAFWKIFQKAGEKGWKAIIPFYNQYTEFKIFWTTKWFWITFIVVALLMMIGAVVVGLAIFAAIGAGIDSDMLSDISGIGALLGVGGTLFGGLIIMAGGIFCIIIDIMLKNRISKSFGHGAGFTCGLVFLEPIFIMILAFNKDKYKKLK